MSPPESPKQFTRKLARAVEGRIKTHIDDKAGLRRGTISILLDRGTVPQPETALKIAKALGCDFEWLCDESDERLDPVRAGEKNIMRLEDVPQSGLIMEVLRRMRLMAIDVEARINAMEVTPDMFTDAAIKLWVDLWERGQAHRPSTQHVGYVRDVIDMVQSLHYLRDKYDLDALSIQFSRHLPPDDGYGIAEPQELTRPALCERYQKLIAACPAIKALQVYSAMVAPDTGAEDVPPDQIEATAGRMLMDLLDSPHAPRQSKLKALRRNLQRRGFVKSNEQTRD